MNPWGSGAGFRFFFFAFVSSSSEVDLGIASAGVVSVDGSPVPTGSETQVADEEVELVDGEVLTENGEYDGVTGGLRNGHALQNGHVNPGGESAARTADGPGASGSQPH